MISYSVYSLIYAIVEISTQPIIHVGQASMYLYVDSFLKYEKYISNPLAAAYCASFGLCVSLLATHFVYRYCAVCRPYDLHHFDGLKLARIYVIPVTLSLIWFLEVLLLLGPTEFKNSYTRKEIEEIYGEDIGKVGYISLVYYYQNPSGTFVISYIDFLAYFIALAIMGACIFTMVICGWKTYQKMGSVKKSMSKKTKELNRQLFKTLVFQTLIPMFTMFAPVGTLLTLPIFSIVIPPFLSNLPSLYAGLYPALDAIIAIFMIRDFRDTVLCRRKYNVSIGSSTGNYTSSVLSG
uniref:Serpentine receptor class r-10 n=2 Tax=Caenorhabditis tropicalis TaxID=1561998 RepID=A0A1I7T5I9_9PELO